MKTPYLQIEAPNTRGTIDFLGPDVSILAEIDGNKLTINVKASHGEDSSSWDQHEFTITLPKKEGGR